MEKRNSLPKCSYLAKWRLLQLRLDAHSNIVPNLIIQSRLSSFLSYVSDLSWLLNEKVFLSFESSLEKRDCDLKYRSIEFGS